MLNRALLVCLLSSAAVIVAQSAERKSYSPARVAYDVSSSSQEEVEHILDRISLLQNLYGSDSFDASIILVIHEGAIPFFTRSSKHSNRKLIQRARSLTLGDVIQFRVCAASARMQGFSSRDFDDFITLVPMADAELVQLQHTGYAYLH